MKKLFLSLLVLALAAYGQERIAILNTVDNIDSIHFTDLAYLTTKLRETAVNVLPKNKYGVMTTESIVAFLGSEDKAVKLCREATCIAEIGRKVSADYVAQARIGRFGGELTINFEIYNSKSGTLTGSFAGNSKTMFGLLAIIDEKTPELFKNMPGSEIKGSVKQSEAKLDKTQAIENIQTANKPINNSITDSRNGKTYKTVEIGTQIWMAENLNYGSGKCLDGNCSKYGMLYDWATAMDFRPECNSDSCSPECTTASCFEQITTKHKGICLEGWHLPNKGEWETLVNYVCEKKCDAEYLKSTKGWKQNGNGFDDFGFNVLPGGLGYNNGSFNYVGEEGYFWSTSEDAAFSAFARRFVYNKKYSEWFDDDKKYMFSVRCVKN